MVIRSALLDGLQRHGQRLGVGRRHAQLDDPALAGGDVGFPANERAVVHDGVELRVAGGCRIDVSAGRQNRRRVLHRLAEVAGDGRHRRKKEISEVVSAEAFAGRKAILEKP